MNELLEDYKRRLETITKAIADLPSNCPDKPDYIRLKAKQGCYKTFITELENTGEFSLEQVMTAVKNSYGLKYFSESKLIKNLKYK